MSILIAGQVLNGFATGMLYAMVGVGLTLVLGVLNIPNFAHGTLYAFGAYFTFTVANWTDSFYLGVLIGPLLVVLMGFVIESQGVRRLYGAHHDYQLLFLFAIALILQETVILIWGPVGFSLLLPPCRHVIKRRLVVWFKSHFTIRPEPNSRENGDRIIDARVVDRSEE